MCAPLLFKMLFVLSLLLSGNANAFHKHASHAHRQSYRQTGIASWYGHESGKYTANGEVFQPNSLTAAIWGLPFNTRVRVTNLNTRKSVIVRVNDRGPARRLHRLIDLSQAAARRIGLGGLGRVLVSE